MISSKDDRLPLLIGGILTTVNVAIIWSFRFLPLHDYSIWLFEAKVLQAICNPLSLYGNHYEVVHAPVPNLAFTLAMVLMNQCVTLEIAGKIFMTFLCVSFPWSVWYCIRSLSPQSDPAFAYVGFPFFFNLFMFSSHNYLLGLSILLCMIGYFVPRFDRLPLKGWLFLGVTFLAIYFTHAITFFLAILTFLSVAFYSEIDRWKKVSRVVLVMLPSVACAIWYVVSNPRMPSGPLLWGIGTMVRNALKPFLLFIRSYGIENQIPLSLCNGLWIIVLFCLAYALIKGSVSDKRFEPRFAPAIIISTVLMIVMPSTALGVVQPGARFAFAVFLFGTLSMVHVVLSAKWKFFFLGVSALLTLYNIGHFRRVDNQSSIFYADLTSHVTLVDPFYLLRYDWSTEGPIGDRLSLSVDPLSLVPYYACLEQDCVCWVHETSFLSLKLESQWYRPDISGATIHDFHTSIMNHMESLRRFPSLIVLGSGTEAASTIKEFEGVGYRATLVRPLWTILRSD